MEELDSRRDMLEAALDQAEEGTLEAPIEKEIEVNDDPIKAEQEPNNDEQEPNSNERDEKGRFKSQKSNANAEEELVADTSRSDEEVKKPTTWKKEYRDIWDKMEKGEQLNRDDFVKFADYANQRENE